MRKAGGGSIVNISSMSGMVGQSYIQPVYNASKGAVRIFTKSAAIQYAKENIRVNSVHPGPIDTPMAGERLNDAELLQREAEERSHPLGRTGASHRGGLRGAVPGVGRVVVRYGSGVGDRRRGDGAVGARWRSESAKLDDAAVGVLFKGENLVVVVAEQGSRPPLRRIAGTNPDDLWGDGPTLNAQAR